MDSISPVGPQAQGSRQKILMIDDTPQNHLVLYHIFRDEHDFFSATSGKEGLERAQELRPDLILLDVMMPEMDGFDVCRALKSSQDLKDIPVLFLTALSEEFNETVGFDAGAVDYIAKPFKAAILKQRVATHLMLKNQRDLLARKNEELEATLARVKLLEGIIPICSYCHKIRNDEDSWQRLEQYLSEHSEAVFSHGICPSCFEIEMKEVKAMTTANSHNL